MSAPVADEDLARAVEECRALIESRFPDGMEHGAAAVLLDDGSILTGTSPDFPNPSTTVCHEVEPYCAAHRLDRRLVASVCLHRDIAGQFLVLSPCGVCRERLALWGADVRVAVAGQGDPTAVEWVALKDALPDYWLTAFEAEVTGWNG